MPMSKSESADVQRIPERQAITKEQRDTFLQSVMDKMAADDPLRGVVKAVKEEGVANSAAMQLLGMLNNVIADPDPKVREATRKELEEGVKAVFGDDSKKLEKSLEVISGADFKKAPEDLTPSTGDEPHRRPAI